MIETCSSFDEFNTFVDRERRIRYRIEKDYLLGHFAGWWLKLTGIAKEGHILVVSVDVNEYFKTKEPRTFKTLDDYCKNEYLYKLKNVHWGEYTEGKR